jgi:hypothetical protein
MYSVFALMSLMIASMTASRAYIPRLNKPLRLQGRTYYGWACRVDLAMLHLR